MTNNVNVVTPQIDFNDDPNIKFWRYFKIMLSIVLVAGLTSVAIYLLGDKNGSVGEVSEAGALERTEQDTDLTNDLTTQNDVEPLQPDEMNADPDVLEAAEAVDPETDNAAPGPSLELVRGLISQSNSSSGVPSEQIVDNNYAESVIFYSSETTRDVIAKQKRSYDSRWPDRSYVIDEPTLSVQCISDRSICFVRGTLEFSAQSIDRNAKSAGKAEFEYGVALRSGELKIVSENSKVIERY